MRAGAVWVTFLISDGRPGGPFPSHRTEERPGAVRLRAFWDRSPEDQPGELPVPRSGGDLSLGEVEPLSYTFGEIFSTLTAPSMYEQDHDGRRQPDGGRRQQPSFSKPGLHSNDRRKPPRALGSRGGGAGSSVARGASTTGAAGSGLRDRPGHAGDATGVPREVLTSRDAGVSLQRARLREQ